MEGFRPDGSSVGKSEGTTDTEQLTIPAGGNVQKSARKYLDEGLKGFVAMMKTLDTTANVKIVGDIFDAPTPETDQVIVAFYIDIVMSLAPPQVQFPEHAADCSINHLLGFNFLNVVVLNNVEDIAEKP